MIPETHRVTIEHALRLTELVVSESPLCDAQELADIRQTQAWLREQRSTRLDRLRRGVQQLRRSQWLSELRTQIGV